MVHQNARPANLNSAVPTTETRFNVTFLLIRLGAYYQITVPNQNVTVPNCANSSGTGTTLLRHICMVLIDIKVTSFDFSSPVCKPFLLKESLRQREYRSIISVVR